MDLVDITGKITGMMLDMDMSELIAMMENEASLEESVKEAINALRE